MEQPSYEMRRQQLLSRLIRQKNGAVVDAMESLSGESGLLSYGVSLPTLKTIVLSYPKDHAFADYLFHTDIRELKLSAVYLSEGLKVTSSQMDSWKLDFVTFEIAVLCGSALFWQSPDAYETALRWISTESDAVVLRTSLIILSRLVSEGRLSSEKDRCLFLLDQISALFHREEGVILMGLSSLLEWLVRKNGSNRELINCFLQSRSSTGSSLADSLLEEISYW